MNSLEAFLDNKMNKGFTLIELLLVVALITVIASFMSPIGISFYRTQLLNETTEGLQSTLRRAQSFSQTGKSDSAYGVRITPGAYILFEGESYDLRTVLEDETYPISSAFLLSGPEEIVFTPLTGEPSTTGTITISSDYDTTYIEVTSSGVIQQ